MLPGFILDMCDDCGNEESPFWVDPGEVQARCTDCYLRAHGYDPSEIGKRFADLAKATLADFINEPSAQQLNEADADHRFGVQADPAQSQSGKAA